MNYSEITPYIQQLADLSDRSNHIVSDMYAVHDVKRGLRDINGNGVVAGLTEVSCIRYHAKKAPAPKKAAIKNAIKPFSHVRQFCFQPRKLLKSEEAVGSVEYL